MKITIFLVILIIAFILNPSLFVFIISNIQYFFIWGIKDIKNYFKHKEYNRCKEWGNIRLNCATSSQVFGCGKTLLLVIRAISIYKRYNDKWVWHEATNTFMKQKIHIISNVELCNIPYIKFVDVNQLIDIDRFEFGPEDVTIFLLDEVGTIFNSRNFRDNISTEFLTRLLQSRKNKVALYMTSQRFQFTDKILREVCNTVTCCRKWWRIVESKHFDAFELENALNPTLIKPKSTTYTFIFDKHYHSYNSYQLVEDLRKNYKPGQYLNTAEILQTYGDVVGGLDYVSNPSRKAKKRIQNTIL